MTELRFKSHKAALLRGVGLHAGYWSTIAVVCVRWTLHGTYGVGGQWI